MYMAVFRCEKDEHVIWLEALKQEFKKTQRMIFWGEKSLKIQFRSQNALFPLFMGHPVYE